MPDLDQQHDALTNDQQMATLWARAATDHIESLPDNTLESLFHAVELERSNRKFDKDSEIATGIKEAFPKLLPELQDELRIWIDKQSMPF